MAIISEATKSAVTELIAQCFVENRMLDRMVSVLGVKFVYNQTADHIHHGMAHLYPVLADEIGEKCLERYNIPVIYGATPAGNQDYSSVKEIIYAVRDRAINFQNMLIGACKIAQDNNDYHALADLLDILEKDSNGEDIKIYDTFSGVLSGQHKDIFDTYFPDNKLRYSDNAELTYIIKDNIVEKNWDSNRNANEMKYVTDNNAVIVTNTKGFTIYKFLNKK